MVEHSLDIEGLDWETEFLPWWRSTWQPGEHVSLIAPTGGGKSTTVRGLLDHRRYVLALDAKGGDSTLDGFGYPRLEKWPGVRSMRQTIERNNEDNVPSRYLIGNRVGPSTDIERLTRLIDQVLTDVFEMGGFTVYADELMVMTDPRQMNLRAKVDALLVLARDKGVSFVSSFQATSWVTPMAIKQPTWIGVSYTRDVDTVNRLAEVLGRPKAEVRGAIKGLDKYCWIFVGRNPREPMRVTIPEYVAPKKTEEK